MSMFCKPLTRAKIQHFDHAKLAEAKLAEAKLAEAKAWIKSNE